MKIPIRYLPKGLTKKDKIKQIAMLLKSRKMYKKGKFYTRHKINSYENKESKHIKHAKHIYNVDSILPNKELSRKTGCSIKGLQEIVRKGEGAYFSSGSRPSQTAQSWGIARLASSITGGKASAVELGILKQECKHNGKAYRLAIKNKEIGRKTTKKETI